MDKFLPIISGLIELLKVNDSRQSRKNLRFVKKTYNHLKKEFSKDGLTKLENEQLNILMKNIINRTIELK